MIIIILSKVCFALTSLYQYILIARVLLSWFPPNYFMGNKIVIFIYSVTDPILNRFQHWFSFLRIGPLDFSAIILFLILEFMRAQFLRTYQYHQLASLLNN